MTLTILVGAPGSLLTATAEHLNKLENVRVIDVEKRLIDTLDERDRKAVMARRSGQSLDMAAVTRAFPRGKVLQLWKGALDVALSESNESDHTIVACHLTLFRNDRSEFYSTSGELLRALGAAGRSVAEVIQLIDDIYDMYGRLASPTMALSAESGKQRWHDFTEKGTPSTLWKGLDHGRAEDAHLVLETRLQILTTLLGWRHQESLMAESLAHSLGARFTAFGVKHKFDSLCALAVAGESAPKTVYVSHPISAYRRLVNTSLNTTGLYEWHEGVEECNSIPASLEADGGIVAVMPTAIDELRLRTLRDDARRLTERSPVLGPRWPLMESGKGLVVTVARELDQVNDADVQHAHLLLDVDSPLADQEFVGEATRLLESNILAEVPYRDHLIVANSHAFLVHRPLADRARLSRGVEHEVRHWRDRRRWSSDTIRLAILHTSEEVRLLRERLLGADWLEDNQRATARANTLSAIHARANEYLEATYELESSDREKVLHGQTLPLDPLGGKIEFSTPASVDRRRREAIIEGVRALVFERLCLLDKLDIGGVALFFLDKDTGLDSARAAPVRQFLAEEQIGDGAEIIVLSNAADPHKFRSADILISDVIMSEFFELDAVDIDIRFEHSRRTGQKVEVDDDSNEADELGGRRIAVKESVMSFYDELVKLVESDNQPIEPK